MKPSGMYFNVETPNASVIEYKTFCNKMFGTLVPARCEPPPRFERDERGVYGPVKEGWLPVVRPAKNRRRALTNGYYIEETAAIPMKWGSKNTTIAVHGFEISVFEGHRDSLFKATEYAKKIYATVALIENTEVELWMSENLPHFVPYGPFRVVKADERAWINRHATGRFSMSSIADGVRFENQDDAFWFKMSRT